MSDNMNYKVSVFDISNPQRTVFVENAWFGDNFDKGEAALANIVERIFRLVRINEIAAGSTRVVLAQHDGSVEIERIV